MSPWAWERGPSARSPGSSREPAKWSGSDSTASGCRRLLLRRHHRARRRAAEEAGRPEPRVAVGLPITLTDDAHSTRAQLSAQTAWYATLPSCRAMFEREGVDGPADLALVGDVAALDAGLARLAAAGATDYLAQIMSSGPGSAARTFEYLAGRAASGSGQ